MWVAVPADRPALRPQQGRFRQALAGLAQQSEGQQRWTGTRSHASKLSALGTRESGICFGIGHCDVTAAVAASAEGLLRAQRVQLWWRRLTWSGLRSNRLKIPLKDASVRSQPHDFSSSSRTVGLAQTAYDQSKIFVDLSLLLATLQPPLMKGKGVPSIECHDHFLATDGTVAV